MRASTCARNCNNAFNTAESFVVVGVAGTVGVVVVGVVVGVVGATTSCPVPFSAEPTLFDKGVAQSSGCGLTGGRGGGGGIDLGDSSSSGVGKEEEEEAEEAEEEEEEEEDNAALVANTCPDDCNVYFRNSTA